MPVLTLDSGRVIAYEQDGDPKSNRVLLFFAGIFSTGSITYSMPAVNEKGLHHIAFTVPGWGNASPIPPSSTFAKTLIADVTALFDHLYADTTNLKIYVVGGSFGSVPAQVVYGASFDVFPLGRNVAGMMILAPFSPFRIHKNYSKCLTWRDWIGVGPLTLRFPHLLSYAAHWMEPKFKTVDSAEKMLRQILFDKMDEPEKENLAEYCQKLGTTSDEFIKSRAEDAVKSVENGFDGLKQCVVALHSDWGFTFPLDSEHARGKVLIAVSKSDTLGTGMGEYLDQNYANSELMVGEGGHLSGMYTLNDTVTDLVS